ncbi:hypothetical protein [Sediminibacterium sp.]|uniref:hypothetical protein n=1 Tax=Sediminibacterium sp. TaxID=1917865 RepID=UPI003F6EAFB8
MSEITNYDIKIVGEDADNGRIEFDRLNLLTKSTKDIATKALMLRLRGFSDITPDKSLKKALSLFLEAVSGNPKDGTSLKIGATHFSDTITGVQYELFKPKEEILKLTPMYLVIDSFHSALKGDREQADLDKPLLKSLLSFKSNFLSDNEIFYLSNRGTIPEIKITKDDFKSISILEESIPSPKKVIVNGQLDEMKVSKGKLGLQTEQGLVNVFANDKSIIENIVEFMGKDITITGIANFKANGQISFVEIQDFGNSGANDKFFSKKPSALSANQQLLFHTKQVKKGNSFQALKDISGLLKDDINDEQFSDMIKDIHR